MGQVEEVADRLRGLRDALGLTELELSQKCGISEDLYRQYESGTADIPVSLVNTIARTFGVEVTALLFGEEPKMTSYFVTRKGCGESVERRDWYKYQSLAAGFAHRMMEPFLVTVEPDLEKQPVHLSSHDGQEFNYVESGSMEIHIDGKVIELNAGDTIMFDARHPHGMRAIGNEQLRFVAIII